MMTMDKDGKEKHLCIVIVRRCTTGMKQTSWWLGWAKHGQFMFVFGWLAGILFFISWKFSLEKMLSRNIFKQKKKNFLYFLSAASRIRTYASNGEWITKINFRWGSSSNEQNRKTLKFKRKNILSFDDVMILLLLLKCFFIIRLEAAAVYHHQWCCNIWFTTSITII